MMTTTKWTSALVLVWTLNASFAFAQDPEAPAQRPAVQSVSPEEFAILANPLTREELIAEAEVWRGHLKAKAQEVAQALVEAHRSREAGTSTDAIMQRIEALRSERAVVMKKLGIVVDAIEAKTRSDDTETAALISEYRIYMRSVDRIRIDTSDLSSAGAAVMDWVKSDRGGRRWAANLALFLGILIGARFIAALVRGIFRRAFDRVEWPELLEDFLTKASYWVIMLAGLLFALSALEVSMGPLLAMVGAAGFIIAFAMQDSLSNFASGLMILFFRPFDTGDVVEAGGVSGKVESLNLVSTTIKTFDNKLMVVPNNSIVGDVVTNATGVNERRIDMEFGIGYSDDIDRAQAVLEEILSSHELVLADPEPLVRLSVLADSSVNFIVRPWVKTPDYWTVHWDVTREVKRRFDAEGIGIPYPQQDVHLHVVNNEAAAAAHDERGPTSANRPTPSMELDSGDD